MNNLSFLHVATDTSLSSWLKQVEVSQQCQKVVNISEIFLLYTDVREGSEQLHFVFLKLTPESGWGLTASPKNEMNMCVLQ